MKLMVIGTGLKIPFLQEDITRIILHGQMDLIAYDWTVWWCVLVTGPHNQRQFLQPLAILSHARDMYGANQSNVLLEA